MSEFLSRANPGDICALIAVVLAFGTVLVCVVTAILARSIRGYRERELAINLVRELAERGLPPDEIEHLLRVTGVNAKVPYQSCQGPSIATGSMTAAG